MRPELTSTKLDMFDTTNNDFMLLTRQAKMSASVLHTYQSEQEDK